VFSDVDINLTEYTKFLIAMLAIVEPLAIVPVYLQATRRFTASEVRKLPGQTALAVLIALLTALFMGEAILKFFGISLGSFRVAGGLLLLIMALQALYVAPGQTWLATDEEGGRQIVVPIAIPLLAGPGALSTVIVYTLRGDAWWHYAMLAGCIVVVSLIVFICLRTASRIQHRLGPTSIAITTKIMGLILAAIGVEFIANGIRALAA
jgi:multiple antibiotic resistance protein